jgi:mono/diheme cytochrome c family protein
MTAKFLIVATLMPSVLISWSQQPNTTTDTHSAKASQPAASTINGRTLFLRNCAHCHGATAHGDEGPGLHNLNFTDELIANRIRKGKAGQMTSFDGKLQNDEIAALVAYVQSLK